MRLRRTAFGVTTGTNVRTTTGPGTWHNESNANADGIYADRTAHSEAQQMWTLGGGWANTWYDESFISTFQAITIAGAERAAASDQVVNVRDPNALVDVDIYESVSPEIESAFFAHSRTARDSVYRPAVNATDAGIAAAGAAADGEEDEFFAIDDATARPHVNDTLAIARAILDEVDTSSVDDAETFAADLTYVVNRAITPWYAKEPNQVADDHQGRATFAGGGYRGTGNTYPGYDAAYAVWLDARAHMRVPYAANVELAPANTAVGVYGDVATASWEPVPGGTSPETSRGTGLLMGFVADIVLWQDFNHDHWLGIVCDPTDESAWDSDNDQCAADPYRDGANPQNLADAVGDPWETVGICGITSLKAGTITLEPVGGSWPLGTTVIKWYDRPTRNVWTQESYIAIGDAAIVLRWDDQCGVADQTNRAVDQVFFPAGNLGVAVKTTVTAILTQRAVDPVLGVDIPAGAQRVTDVDVYAASL